VPEDKNGLTGSKSSLPAAPQGALRAMRIVAIVGPVCSVLCIVLGAFEFSQHHGIAILTLGCVLFVFWTIMIPSVRRSGKL
jgi:hypothetical protein